MCLRAALLHVKGTLCNRGDGSRSSSRGEVFEQRGEAVVETGLE